jgi:hypothetical protein
VYYLKPKGLNQLRRQQSSERRYFAANGEMRGQIVGIASRAVPKPQLAGCPNHRVPRPLTANGGILISHQKQKNARF